MSKGFNEAINEAQRHAATPNASEKAANRQEAPQENATGAGSLSNLTTKARQAGGNLKSINAAADHTMIYEALHQGQRLAEKMETARMLGILDGCAQLRSTYSLDLAAGFSRIENGSDKDLELMLEEIETYDPSSDLGKLKSYAKRGEDTSSQSLLSGVL